MRRFARIALAAAACIAIGAAEMVDDLKVSSRLVTDDRGYAVGVRSDVLNCRTDRAVAIAVLTDPVDRWFMLVLDAEGRPVSAPPPDEAVDINRKDGAEPPRHVVVPPQMGLSIFAPLPRTIRDRSAPAGELRMIPTPDGRYTVRYRPLILFVEVDPAAVAGQGRKDQPYRYVKVGLTDFPATMHHERMVDDWVRRWAE